MKKKEHSDKPSMPGTCDLCHATLPKITVTTHLESCVMQQATSGKQPITARSRKTRIFRILVEGSYQPQYWMHIEIPAALSLLKLDDFLRSTWLECCGHLSAFKIDGVSYMEEGPEELDTERMNVSLGRVLSPGMKFDYEYDFGSTTELQLKVVSEREGEFKGESAKILARNDPPFIPCDSCGKNNAAVICTECDSESIGGWLCDECAKEHECDEEMRLPVVNSPRTGVCGYDGQ
ncbi:MAG: hypothetical protein HY730_06170 [Candidatus Tectomicrobia bacterium]|uniref:Plasmid pRiA4b Orf3-like domain-containing protein n=1 Tax=Tectimicrobiota bacterium TaxID=2528274 RepID=A0A933LQQ1_UNCTE|nr:hypothetical protein [Candidatus Tectomicrobia bacterium]